MLRTRARCYDDRGREASYQRSSEALCFKVSFSVAVFRLQFTHLYLFPSRTLRRFALFTTFRLSASWNYWLESHLVTARGCHHRGSDVVRCSNLLHLGSEGDITFEARKSPPCSKYNGDYVWTAEFILIFHRPRSTCGKVLTENRQTCYRSSNRDYSAKPLFKNGFTPSGPAFGDRRNNPHPPEVYQCVFLLC